MDKIDQIKEKLRKLIAKLQSARELGNLAEAEAFAAKIQSLLLEYELSMDDFKRDNKAEDSINREEVSLTQFITKNEGIWVYKLYAVFAYYNFCKVIFPYKYSYNYLTLIGTPINREFVHYFALQLVSKLRELARRSYREYVKDYMPSLDQSLADNPQPDKPKTYIRSFLLGAVDGISNRLSTERMKAKAMQPQVNALVLVKDAALKKFMEENFPSGSLSKAKGTSSSSSSGYSKGYLSGSSVSINKGVSGNRGMGGTKLLG